MSFSVNTNASALVALQNLNSTNKALDTTQNRINTGLKVSSAKDNAAIYAIAQSLRSDVGGLNAVQQSLDRAQGATDVALAAGEAVADLLVQMKEKAVAAADPGTSSASRTALNDDFVQLRDQIASITNDAEFNGINAVKSGGDAIVAITNDDATSTITVAATDLSLGSANVTITATESFGATASSAAAVVAKIEASITATNSALSKLGSGSTRLELQQEFTTKLSDSIEAGIGKLVDADLAKESANLQSLQVKQELGLQALSIANQGPSAVLSLFR